MGYSRRKLNYLERIVPFDPSHIVSVADLVVIGVVEQMIYRGCSL